MCDHDALVGSVWCTDEQDRACSPLRHTGTGPVPNPSPEPHVTGPLATWNPGPAKGAILDLVARTCADGSPEWVPPEERVAVFDNDGTLWCEKPMPIQLDFILQRLAEMAARDSSLRERQPWKAAHERDHGWLAQTMAQHYAGDDTDVQTLGAGIVAAFANVTVDQFEADSDVFLRTARHPTLGRGYLECAYAPMVELLAHLRTNGFATYIASGGGRDFMRPISDEVYGIPREGVIGSAVALAYTPDGHGGAITRQAAADYLDDGPEKPVRIWNRTGRRPVLAAGNSNGDIEMLDYTQHPDKPSLRLLVLHDDAEREFDYVSGAESALDRAAESGWTVVSIRNDWVTVF
jgi:phosphoglycolate phosphatase-like HAD superfamily hydrolase